MASAIVIEKASWQSWLMLTLLCLAFLLSLVDRLLLSLLVEPIKADLGLTDTQIGLIQGLAFVVLYSGLALPVGRYVDRHKRIPLVSGGVALWSLMTAVCGLATTPLALALGRAGVGIGESTLGPAAPSLIADSFPKARLGLAMSIFALGASLGAGLSLMLGGAITHALEISGPKVVPGIGILQPWQQTFLVVGLPGVLLAVAIAALKEPERQHQASSIPTIKEVVHHLRANKRWFVPLVAANGLVVAVAFGTASWIIAFFARTYGTPVNEAGFAAGLVTILGGLTGLLAGGLLSDRLSRTGTYVRLWVCAAAMALTIIPAFLYPFANSMILSVMGWGFALMCASIPVGVASANLQEMTPSRMRGTVSAAAGLFASLIGMGLGPALIALVADEAFGETEGLKFALATVAPIAAGLSAGLFVLAAHYQQNAKHADVGRKIDLR